jgi:hypothetical protein
LRVRPCLAEQGWIATAPDRNPTILLAADTWDDDSVVVPPLDAERTERFGHGPVTDASEVAWAAWARQHNADAELSRALDTSLPEVRGTSWGTPFGRAGSTVPCPGPPSRRPQARPRRS